jgi:hypothetical protein
MDSESTRKTFRIATVATLDYFPFLLVFLGSLFKNVDTSRISTVEILVDELPKDLHEYLERFDKVRLHHSDKQHSFQGAHSAGWKGAVSEKLVFCRGLLTHNTSPLLLIDSDILFVRDLSVFENITHPVTVTLINDPSERHVRRDNLKIYFIGAAVFFNDAVRSANFVDDWLSKMRELERDGYRLPHETPALNLLIEEYVSDNRVDLGFIPDDVIAADQKIKEETVAVHLKSWGPTSNSPYENFMLRSSRVSWPANLNPASYLDFTAYETWLIHQKYPNFG